jgi:alpha-L-fucosidase
MKRRTFLAAGWRLGAGLMAGSSLYACRSNQVSAGHHAANASTRPASRFSHQFPLTDVDYMRHRSYIEEIPVSPYKWASDEAYEAFLDIKYGVRLHWGLYSAQNQMGGESWPFLNKTFAERQAYNEFYKTWNPAGFDAEEWMSLFQESGIKMFAFTSKHHEGFSMFDTKTRVKQRINWTAAGGPKIENCDLAYSIMETPFKRDVIKELTDAARKYQIKVDLYFSHSDWYDADFRPYGYHPLQVPAADTLLAATTPISKPPHHLPEAERARQRLGDKLVMVPDPSPEEVKRMINRHRTQLKELLSNYGPIDMLCLDIWLGPAVWTQMRETLLEIRKLQPNVMLRARGIGNYGDYFTPEGFVPGNKENSDMPWFVIYPLGRTFSYEAAAEKHKGAAWIIKNLLDSMAKGGNFMVGIGPDKQGTFHPTAVSQLKEVGRWLKVNGAGIYATRAREGDLWSEGELIRYARSKDRKLVFAFSTAWPGPELVLQKVTAREGAEITLLGYASPLSWRNDPAKGLVISIPENLQPEDARPCLHAWGFKIPVA